MTDAILEALYQSSLEDIVFVRRFPPNGARTPSYFGGLPRLPSALAWPASGHTGLPVTFLAQVDLRSLPPFQSRARLPDEGTLFFFVDSTLGRDWEESASVLFAPQPCIDIPEREAPSDLPPIYGEVAHYHIPWLGWNNTGPFPAPRLMPYWPVDPVVVRTFPEESRNTQGDRGAVRTVRSAEERKILNAIFGERVKVPSLSFASQFPQSANLPAGCSMSPFVPGEPWFPDEEWPYSWIFAAIFCAKLLASRSESYLGVRLLEEAASAWRGAAHEAGLFSPMSEDSRARFRVWVQSMPWRLPSQSGPKTSINLPSFGFHRLIVDTTLHGMNACLGYAGAIKGLFPDYLLAFCAGGRHPYTRRHQLFGAPRQIQTAIDDYGGTHILLAQFDYDEQLLWYWGDVGALQFWITPQDLTDLRFDQAFMTAESG